LPKQSVDTFLSSATAPTGMSKVLITSITSQFINYMMSSVGPPIPVILGRALLPLPLNSTSGEKNESRFVGGPDIVGTRRKKVHTGFEIGLE
jgi:hypothetical protein